MQVLRTSTQTIVEASPIGDAILTYPFGPRPPILTPGGWTTADFHFGADLIVLRGTTLGTPIMALREGEAFGYDDDPRDGAGLVVRLRHDEYETEYFHTQDGAWRPPDGFVVQEGLTFAQVGNTGASTGPHLHLTLRKIGGSFEYFGFNGQRYVTNHIDPLSEEGLAFWNKEEVQYTLLELGALARIGVFRGDYELRKVNGQQRLLVDTQI